MIEEFNGVEVEKLVYTLVALHEVTFEIASNSDLINALTKLLHMIKGTVQTAKGAFLHYAPLKLSLDSVISRSAWFCPAAGVPWLSANSISILAPPRPGRPASLASGNGSSSGYYRETSYRIGEIRINQDDPVIKLIWDWQPRPATSLRVQFENALGKTRLRERHLYVGPRSTGIINFIERRDAHLGSTLDACQL